MSSGVSIILSEAGFYNSLVNNADELPDINESVMNEVEINYEENGIEGISEYFEQINEIAHQCSYQGGPAVYRARYFLSLFNDSIEYDDASVCLAQGILRTNLSQKIATPNLLIKPNPTSNDVEIKLSGAEDLQYTLAITDVQGRELFTLNNFPGNEAIRLHTSDFVPGVYYLIARKNKSPLCSEKLIIIR